jgi:serine/threonine protein kinase
MTGDDYLQLSLDAVQQLVDDTRVLQLNEKQCGLLTKELLKVVTSVGAAIDRLPTEKQAFVRNRHEFASQELYRWVTESAAIINSCRAEDWVKKAVELGYDTTEMFVEAIFKLRWCGAVLESVILNAAKSYTTGSDLQHSAADIFRRFGAAACERKKEKFRNMLKEPAMQDHENLRRRLHVEREGRGGVADKKDVKLVAYLLESKPDSSALFLPKIDPEDYVLKEKIGGGAFGQVFKLCWLGQDAAIKCFQGDKASFEHEKETMAGLSHPHLVRALGFSEHQGGRCSLIMELMVEDLNSFMLRASSNSGNAPFQFHVALDIMLQVAEAMQFLQMRRIAHRDLKPTNIVVSPVENVKMAGYLRVKVCDFGSAKLCTSSYVHTRKVGTSVYRAPELNEVTKPQKRNHPLKVDTYSYGITSNEICTGDEPYSSEPNYSVIFQKIKFEGLRPQLPPSLPPYPASLIQTCWHSDPSRRPNFAEICAHLGHLKAVLMIGKLFQPFLFSPWGLDYTSHRVYMFQNLPTKIK